jgi:hypothetical protein
MQPFFILCLTLLFSAPLHAALEVNASVTPNPVFVEERFILTVTANANADKLELDRDAMLRQGLVVGATNVSRSMQIINGDSRRETTWRTEIYARQAGIYTLPAAVVDGVKGQPLQIDVRPIPKQTGPARDLFIDAELSAPSAYPGQQLTYTVKLYLGEELRRGSLAEPQLADAEIRSIGSDKESTEIVDGRRYQVIQRTFAIVPGKAGIYQITGANIKGQLVKQKRNGQLYGIPVNESAPTLALEVKPQPESFTEHWLPSELVTLHDEWQPSQTQLTVGEPVTRTITLSAVGIDDKLLPTLQQSYPASVKVYPDKTENDTYVQDQHLIAQRVESVALVPTQAGEITFPAIRVAWWNTKTEQLAYAELPARTFKVNPAADQPVNLPIVNNTVISSEPQQNWFWPFVLVTILWLLTVLCSVYLAIKLYRRPSNISIPKQQQEIPSHKAFQALLQACKSNQPKLVQHALIKWLFTQGARNRRQWLASLNETDATIIRAELDALDMAAKNGAPWSAERLLAQLKQQQTKKEKQGGELPPLYPTQ